MSRLERNCTKVPLKALVEQFANFSRQGNYDEKRELILRAAATLFVERGIHGTSLNEIAQRFHISKPALYHYARNKDDIVAQILDAAAEKYRELLENNRQRGGSGREQLINTVREYGDLLNLEIGRCIATIPPSTLSGEIYERYRSTHRILLNGIADIVDMGIRDGSIGPCQPKIVVLALLSGLNSTIHWHRGNGNLSRLQTTDEILRYFLDGIAA